MRNRFSRILFILVIAFTANAQTIPNSGFEKWSIDGSYNIAVGIIPDSTTIDLISTDILPSTNIDNLESKDLSLDMLSTNNQLIKFVEIKTYPNPTTDKIFIEYKGVDNQLSINIYNFVGKLVKLSRLNQFDDIYEIDVSDLPTGAYFLEIKSGITHLQTKKLIIN